MAARGAGAAARADAAHRRAHDHGRGRSGSAGPHRGVPAGAAGLGWTDGRNVRIDYRWGAGDADRCRRYAAELVALAPDVILASGSSTVSALATGDPHRADRVRECHRSGRRRLCRRAWRGRAAMPPALLPFEYGISGKWLELLKEIAPSVTRAAVLRDPAVRRRDRPIRRYPVRGAVARGGAAPDRCARRGRDRARRHCIRAASRMAA